MAPEIQDLTHGHGVDVVIEITGKIAALEMACDIVKPASLLGYEGRGKILIPSPLLGQAGLGILARISIDVPVSHIAFHPPFLFPRL